MQAQASDGAKVVEGDLVRMAVVVANSRGDQGRPRAGGTQQRGAAARA